MVPVNFIFERSVFEARSFLAVSVRMIKLFCRKKLAPRISVVHPQSFISNYAKSAAGTASLQADSPSGDSSGSNLFLQHSSTAHTASTLQSKEREEATGSRAVPDVFQPRGNIHKSTHSIFQNYLHDLTWQKGVEKFGEHACFLETVNISAK